MEIKNCKRCNNIFQYLDGPQICRSCKQKEEEEFQELKKYLKEHPNLTIIEVSKAVDISVERIQKYLREGRLQVVQGSAIRLECEKCGTKITTGRYCSKCKDKLEGAFKTASSDIRDKALKKHVMNYINEEQKKNN